MNGMILQEKIPKFVDTTNLPSGYFDEVNPHAKRPPCSINIRKLSQYVTEHNCDVADISKEESKFFLN